MNVKLLKSKMVLYGDEDFVKDLADLLNITRQTASAKLNGITPFTQPEITISTTLVILNLFDVRTIQFF